MLNLQSVPDLDLVFLSQFLIISYYLWLWKWWCSLWCKSQGYMQSILELFVFEQWNWFLPILKNIFQLHIDVCHFLKDVKFPGEHSRINLRWALKIGSNTATFLWNKIFRKKSNTLLRDNNSKKYFRKSWNTATFSWNKKSKKSYSFSENKHYNFIGGQETQRNLKSLDEANRDKQMKP